MCVCVCVKPRHTAAPSSVVSRPPPSHARLICVRAELCVGCKPLQNTLIRRMPTQRRARERTCVRDKAGGNELAVGQPMAQRKAGVRAPAPAKKRRHAQAEMRSEDRLALPSVDTHRDISADRDRQNRQRRALVDGSPSPPRLPTNQSIYRSGVCHWRSMIGSIYWVGWCH